LNTKQITLTAITAAACASFAIGISTLSMATPAAHRHTVAHHRMVTVNSLGIMPLKTISDNGAIALAPKGWSMKADDHGTVEMHSPDRDSYAGWGVIQIDRVKEQYYGKMYGAPEESIQAIMSAALTASGESGDVQYTSDAKQIGRYAMLNWQTSDKTGRVFYIVYGDPSTSYIESFYLCYTDHSKWKKLATTLSITAISIQGHTVLHPAPDGGYHYTPSSDNHEDSGSGEDGDPMKDYNQWTGNQWFHDDAGNNYYLDPNDCTTMGPDGEGVYKTNGNDTYKLHAGMY